MSSNKNPYFLPIGNSGMMKRWIVDNVDIPAIKHCHTAGVPMNAGTGVYMNTDGKIYPYVTGKDEVYLGVLEDPAYTNKPVTVVYAGYLSIEGTGWTAGVPYLVQNGGNLATTGDFQVAVGVGTDAIVVFPRGGSGGVTEDNRGVYFVDKRYNNEGAAWITGFTPADITSTNTSYSTQLALATRGSTINPWPDPWSARNQAYQDIQDGLIDVATIVVLSGEWTMGTYFNAVANQFQYNGGVNGTTPNTGVVPDVAFTETDGGYIDNKSSILLDGLNFFFHPGTSITNISSTYYTLLITNYITTNLTQSQWKASLKGHLNYKEVYGTDYTFLHTSILLAQPNTEAELEFNKVEMGGPNSYGFIDTGFFKRVSLKINEFVGYGGGVLFTTFGLNQDDAPTHNQIADGLSETIIEVQSYKNLASLDPSLAYTSAAGIYSFLGDEIWQPYSGSYLVTIKVDDVYVEGAVSLNNNLMSLDDYLPFNSKINAQYGNVRVYADVDYLDLQVPQSWEGSLVNANISGHNSQINVKLGNVESEFPLLWTTRLSTQLSDGTYGTAFNIPLDFKIHTDFFLKKFNNINGNQSGLAYLIYLYDDNTFTTASSDGMLYVSGHYRSSTWIIYSLGNYSGVTTYRANFSGYYHVDFAAGPLRPVLYLDGDRLSNFISITDAILKVPVISGTIYAPATDTYEILIKNVMVGSGASATVSFIGETPTYNPTAIGSYFR